jgi:SH3-like domain-containing protein
MKRQMVKHPTLVTAFALALLIALFSAPSLSFSFDMFVKTVRDAGSVTVLKAEASNEKIPIGTMQFSITRGNVDKNELFSGPPVDQTWPKDGFTFVMVQIAIGASTEKQWLDLVQTAELRDNNGGKHPVSLWYFRNAYRMTMFMNQAAGLGVGPETRLMFNIKQPLPSNLRLFVDKQEVATLQLHREANAREDAGLQRTVYAVIDRVSLKPEPQWKKHAQDTFLSLGQALAVIGKEEDWLRVKVVGDDRSGWVHKSTVIQSREMLEAMKKINMTPTNLIYVERADSRSTFNVAVVAGQVEVSSATMRAIPKQGNCLVFSEQAADRFRQVGGVELKGFGVEDSISAPEPGALYIYQERDKQYRLIAERLAGARPVPTAGVMPAVYTTQQKQPDAGERFTSWPAYQGRLDGGNLVRVRNPNDYAVRVGLRSDGRGKDFLVVPGGVETVSVPNGRYDVYFHYSNDPAGLYQGDSFALSNNGVEIRIVKVADGNYGIRKVK